MGLVLNGQRLPTGALSAALANDLKLSATEAQYFELLVKRAKLAKRPLSGRTSQTEARHAEQVRRVELEMERLKPRSLTPHYLEREAFVAIADWHHFAIKQLVTSPNFRDDARWISRKLRGKITPTQARAAIDRLLCIGLLERDPESRKLKPSVTNVFTQIDMPSRAVRVHHAQMMDRAKEAIDEQEISNRELNSLTMIFDKSRLEEAKKALREFRDRFNQEFLVATNASETVYQLNFQFFEHTGDADSSSTPRLN